MSDEESKTRSSQSELSLICIHHNLTRNHASHGKWFGISARPFGLRVWIFWNLVAPANIHDSSLAKHRAYRPKAQPYPNHEEPCTRTPGQP